MHKYTHRARVRVTKGSLLRRMVAVGRDVRE